MMEQNTTPRIAIVMCTYNGQTFLPAQIDSFLAQTYTQWDLWVSDDGSHDNTRQVIARKMAPHPEHVLHSVDGPQQGFARNFMSLVTNTDIDAHIFALSDQDDIWLPDKLERAKNWLASVPVDIPALYTSRVDLIGENDEFLGQSTLFTRTPAFANALIQNIAGGHAMVINRAARDMLVKVGQVDIPFHDWWIYALISGVGGRITYDPTPTVRYRQHGTNVVGLNTGALARIVRLKNMFRGDYGDYHGKNCSALNMSRHLLNAESRAVLDKFCAARGASLWYRIWNMKKSGVFGQTTAKTASFWLMVVLGKV